VDEKNSKVHQEEVGCNHAPASNLSSLDGSLFYRSEAGFFWSTMRYPAIPVGRQ
jgi:hypothetical protein